KDGHLHEPKGPLLGAWAARAPPPLQVREWAEWPDSDPGPPTAPPRRLVSLHRRFDAALHVPLPVVRVPHLGPLTASVVGDVGEIWLAGRVGHHRQSVLKDFRHAASLNLSMCTRTGRRVGGGLRGHVPALAMFEHPEARGRAHERRLKPLDRLRFTV